jgi:hypothetical protein
MTPRDETLAPFAAAGRERAEEIFAGRTPDFAAMLARARELDGTRVRAEDVARAEALAPVIPLTRARGRDDEAALAPLTAALRAEIEAQVRERRRAAIPVAPRPRSRRTGAAVFGLLAVAAALLVWQAPRRVAWLRSGGGGVEAVAGGGEAEVRRTAPVEAAPTWRPVETPEAQGREAPELRGATGASASQAETPGESGPEGRGATGAGESGPAGRGATGAGESGPAGRGATGAGESGLEGRGATGAGESGPAGRGATGAGESGPAGRGATPQRGPRKDTGRPGGRREVDDRTPVREEAAPAMSLEDEAQALWQRGELAAAEQKFREGRRARIWRTATCSCWRGRSAAATGRSRCGASTSRRSRRGASPTTHARGCASARRPTRGRRAGASTSSVTRRGRTDARPRRWCRARTGRRDGARVRPAPRGPCRARTGRRGRAAGVGAHAGGGVGGVQRDLHRRQRRRAGRGVRDRGVRRDMS